MAGSPSIGDRIGSLIQAVLIVYIAWKYYKNNIQSKICASNDPHCVDDYFSANYAESRTKFLSHSEAIPFANTYHIPIASEHHNDLFTDITILNEDSLSNHLVLHFSGVHGVEGYVGSGIQNYLLHQIEKGVIDFGDDGTGSDSPPIIMFVHAVNPFGFASTRRVNEDNIDLNRNLKTEAQWKALSEGGPNAFHYEDCSGFFNPTFYLKAFSKFLVNLPAPIRPYFINLFHNFNYLSMWMRAAYYALTVGQHEMKSAGVIGEMHDPKGAQYVGNGQKAESHSKLMAFLKEKFEAHPHWRDITKITFIDVHSGDSGYGVDKLLTESTEHEMKLKQMFLEYDDKDLIQSLQSKESTDSTQFWDGIYEHANGYSFEYAHFVRGLVAEEQDVDLLAFASEFGSNHWLETVGMCQIMENAYLHEYEEAVANGEVNEGEKEVLDALLKRSKKWLKMMFYVDEPEWKKIVVKRGMRVFTQSLLRGTSSF